MGNDIVLALAPTITKSNEFSERLFIDVPCMGAAYDSNPIPLVGDIRH
jgi:hypothetical protein